jgi:excisionase family DNA binding protein
LFYCIYFNMSEKDLLTTREVAERLNVSLRRVRALIEAGKLPSQQLGRDHLIKESDLKLVKDRKPGRPAKAKD